MDFEQFENGKLPAMIERAGYPGIAADLDREKIAEILPILKKRPSRCTRKAKG